jgi:hypothetical protein
MNVPGSVPLTQTLNTEQQLREPVYPLKGGERKLSPIFV